MATALVPLSAYIILLQFRYFHDPSGLPRHRLESPLFILAGIAFLCLWLLRPDRQSPPVGNEDATPRRSIFTVIAVVLSLAVYWPSLPIGLLSDDYVLRRWALAHDFAGAGHEFVRPLPLVLWSALLAAGGGSVALHATSLLLHAINAFLVAELAWLLELGAEGAVIAMAVFLAWPTQVEPVVWASGIFDVAVTCFCLGAVLLIVRHDVSVRGICGAALLSVAALLSKESGIALPVLAAIILLAGREIPLSRSRMTGLALIASMTFAYAVWRIWLRPHAAEAAAVPALSRYAVKELVSRTFGGLSVPFTIDAIASAPWTPFLFAAVPLGAAIGSLVVIFRRTREHRAMAAGLLWIPAAAAPAIAFLFVDGNLAGSRYLYLPAVGWALFIGALASLAARRAPAARAVVTSLATLMIVAALLQNRNVQRDWLGAAADRDLLLDRAADATARAGCATAVFRDVPETHGAAQLFRNGFGDAFAERTPLVGGGVSCRFRWDGSSFVPE